MLFYRSYPPVKASPYPPFLKPKTQRLSFFPDTETILSALLMICTQNICCIFSLLYSQFLPQSKKSWFFPILPWKQPHNRSFLPTAGPYNPFSIATLFYDLLFKNINQNRSLFFQSPLMTYYQPQNMLRALHCDLSVSPPACLPNPTILASLSMAEQAVLPSTTRPLCTLLLPEMFLPPIFLLFLFVYHLSLKVSSSGYPFPTLQLFSIILDYQITLFYFLYSLCY